jgi:hypothetical protein
MYLAYPTPQRECPVSTRHEVAMVSSLETPPCDTEFDNSVCCKLALIDGYNGLDVKV